MLAWSPLIVVALAVGIAWHVAGCLGQAPAPTGTPGTSVAWKTAIGNWQSNFVVADLHPVRDVAGRGVVVTTALEGDNGGQTNHLQYIDDTGSVVWSKDTTSPFVAHTARGLVSYANATDASVIEVADLATGAVLWWTKGQSALVSTTVVRGLEAPFGTCAVVATFAAAFVCYDVRGAAVWTLKDGGNQSPTSVGGMPAVAVRLPKTGDEVVIAALQSGIVAVRLATGEKVWTNANATQYAAIDRESVTSQYVLYTISESSFTLLNTTDGTMVWSHTSASNWPVEAVIAPKAGVVMIVEVNPNGDKKTEEVLSKTHDKNKEMHHRRGKRARSTSYNKLKSGNNYPTFISAYNISLGPTASTPLWGFSTGNTISHLGVLARGRTESEAVAFATTDQLHVLSADRGRALAAYGPIQDYNQVDPPVDGGVSGGRGRLYFSGGSLQPPYNVYVWALWWGAP